MNLVGIIPAHLASLRFPRKILYEFDGIPMIEHVRRRALQSNQLSSVIVATCDSKIADVVESFGGEVILTSNKHKNGTSRVAEAVSKIDCSHVLLLQGDEPLLLPKHIDKISKKIQKFPKIDSWNAIGKLDDEEELDRHSFVKCVITNKDKILFCFRRSPSHTTFVKNKNYIFKILGIIAYKKNVLIEIAQNKQTFIEKNENIEQLRILEYGYSFYSVLVTPTLPSVNEPEDVEIIKRFLQKDDEQRKILNQIKLK